MDFSLTQLHDTAAPAVLMSDSDIDLIGTLSGRLACATLADGDPTSPSTVMRRTLADMFCEADPLARARAFDARWHPNAVIYHGENARAGRAAALEVASRFHERMEGLNCRPSSPVSGSSDLYMLRWIAERAGEPVATGCCIGFLVRGRIHSFYMIED